jgi:hypothetical protein
MADKFNAAGNNAVAAGDFETAISVRKQAAVELDRGCVTIFES